MSTISNQLLFRSSIGDFSSLNGASGIKGVTIGDRTFLYAAARFSDSVIIYELFSDGGVTQIGQVTNTVEQALDGASALEIIQIKGQTFVYVGASSDNAVSVFQAANDGSLTLVQVIADTPLLELDQPFGEMTTTKVGNKTFLLVHGFDDDGISVFQVANNGQLTARGSVDDAANTEFTLDGIVDTTSAIVGGKTFVFAGGKGDDGISVFQLSGAGQLTFVTSVRDAGDLLLRDPEGMVTATSGGKTYLYVAGNSDDGISVFEVSNSGALTNRFNYSDSQSIALNGVNDLDVFTLAGTQYLVATGEFDHGVSYFRIGSDGGLTHIDTAFDSENTAFELNGTEYADVVKVDGKTFLVATGDDDDGLTVFELGATSLPIRGTQSTDLLYGSADNDSMSGLRGDDVLVGEEGDDFLDGGQGSDLISGGDGNDRILGDGDLTRTASDVVTIAETGQDLAVSVTLPDASNNAKITISGLINRTPVTGNDYNIVYVIDVSGSMSDLFTGDETVPDLNGDGAANRLLDGTIAAFQSLNNSIVDAGFGSSDLSIVTFNSSANTVFRGSPLGGVDAALTSLDDTGGTDFEAALQRTITELNQAGAGQNVVYFISDGGNNEGGSILDEVATLTDANGLDAVISAIGLGQGANLNDLDLVDDGVANLSASRVLLPSNLTASLTGSPVQTSEVDRLEVLVNDVLVRTINAGAFEDTPLGLQYTAQIDGLSTSSGDLIEVRLVASDQAATTVDVSLQVPSGRLTIGDDVINAGAGDDVVEGNGGNDRIFGEDGADGLNGGAGTDLLHGGGGNDRLLGQAGADTLIGGRGTDTLEGGRGNDVYYIDRFDVVDERSGSASDFNTLVSRLSIDLRSDNFLGSFEGARLLGDADIRAEGTQKANVLAGNAGDNRLTGLGGSDTINGGGGKDTLLGGNGNDSLSGAAGNDRLDGGFNKDILRGGTGADTLIGGNGQDRLDAGKDSARDVFVFSAKSHSGTTQSTRDVLLNFDSGEDKINLSRLDADSSVAGNQTFTFGTGPASNAVWVKNRAGAQVQVFIDLDGDAQADMQLMVNGSANLVAGDFIL